MKTFRSFLFSFALALSIGSGRAADPVASVIEKARASIGSEAALNGITSLHYVGTLETTGEGENAGKKITLQIELIYQKPAQQRVVITVGGKSNITCLDDYEAWERQQDLADPKNWTMTILSPEDVQGLRASTWETLSYFRGIEARGGRVEDRGTGEVDGVVCRKLAFVYNEDRFFIRYFAADSGKLMLSETARDEKIREQGEIRVNGIRFPKRIVTTTRRENGTDHVVTVAIERIEVNEKFPGRLFQVPPPGE